ncbi:BCCT family transporter, partial [Streptomyces sp. SP18BB07]|nr:BCCT family transporter [Streptomyces sp. SP18BB07]
MSSTREQNGSPGHPVGEELPGIGASAALARTDLFVFVVAAALTLAFVVWGATASDSLESVSGKLLDGTIRYGGWAFVL